MMFSPEFENKILDSLFRGQPLNLGFTSFFIGLIKTDGSEVSEASYARTQINCSLLHWKSTQGNTSASTGNTGKIETNIAIEFPEALENWGLVNKLRFFVANTGTTYFVDYDIDPVNISIGNTVVFAPGDIEISIRE